MNRTGLRFLRGWQRIVRFGGTALSIATLLVLLGLFTGTRRSRIGVLLFGIGGLSLIVAPALTANFWGRYTVPMAGPLGAAAAIAIAGLWSGRRGEEREMKRPAARLARRGRRLGGRNPGAVVLAVAYVLIAPELAKLYPAANRRPVRGRQPLVQPEPREEARAILTLAAPLAIGGLVIAARDPRAGQALARSPDPRAPRWLAAARSRGPC